MRYSFATLLLTLTVVITTLPTRIIVVGYLDESPRLAVKSVGIACETTNSVTSLEVSVWQRASLTKALLRSYQAMAYAKKIIETNIANHNTLTTAEGIPYRRQYPTYALDGSFKDIQEDTGDFNWIYDPAHLLAQFDGPHRGYVAHPNINLIQEQALWDQLNHSQQTVRELIRRLDPSLDEWVRAQDVPESSSIEPSPEAFNAMFSENFSWSFNPKYRWQRFNPDWQVAQESPDRYGLASVANALNWLFKAPRFTSQAIENRYGPSLLNALKNESKQLELDWKDAGNLSETIWPVIAKALASNLPVIIAYREPDGTRLERIVMLVGLDAEEVIYANPATGKLARINYKTLLKAPSHGDGNFVFIPTSVNVLPTLPSHCGCLQL